MATGKRSGARTQRAFRPRLLGLAAGVTVAVVVWGYLVFEAVDFGRRARTGEGHAWWFLATAAVGAVACLFVALLLIVRILRILDAPKGPLASPPARGPDVPRTPGGKRAAR